MRFLVLLLALLTFPAMALPLPEELALGEQVTAEGAIDGDTIRIGNGKELRLIGLLAPKDDEPLADTARKILDKLVRGKKLILAGEAPPDRYRRRRAHAAIAGSETWLEAEMLLRGLARVATQPDAAGATELLLSIERQAREERQGLWADKRYQVRQAVGHVPAGRFEIVEGTVLSTGRGKGITYINFGPDWRTDFTLSYETEAGKRLRQAKISPKSLEGLRVRARGFVVLTNGPMIVLSHPEQLELLDPPPEKRHKSGSASSKRPPPGEVDP